LPVLPEDLKELIGVADPQMSPDGGRIAFVRSHQGDENRTIREIWMVDSRRGEPSAFTSGVKDRHPRWSPDGEAIAFIGERAKDQPQIFVIPTAGGEARLLTDFPEGLLAEFKWSPDGASLAVKFREQDPAWTTDAVQDRRDKNLTDPPRVIDDWWYRLDGDGYFNAQRYQLFIIDVETGAHRVLYAKDRMGFFDFDWSPNSRELVVSTNRHRDAMISAKHTGLMRIDARTGKATTIPNLPAGPKSAVAWSPDGHHIAYAGREGEDSEYSTENLQLWVCDARRGGAKCLTAEHDICLLAPALSDTAEVAFEARLQWSKDSKRILFELGWQGETHVAAIPRTGGAITMLTTGANTITLGPLSAKGDSIALLSGNATRPVEVYRGDVNARAIKVHARTSFNTAYCAAHAISPITSRWVPTADGTKVQVWVMMPPAATGAGRTKQFPGVLEIHGGPHAQYGVGFFHEFQVLASAGYVVVFANPRGSKGYGRNHCAAIRGHWGTADWVDMQAVIEFMENHPTIHTKRMAVMGGSYGGYMTNWIIGHTTRFAAAITDRCVSNMHSMVGSSDFANAPDKYFPGNAWTKPEALWEQSPLRLAGNVKTPTLLIHSEGDLRCNIEQAEQFYTALRLNGVKARFVRYPRTTSHGMSRSGPVDMRLHRLHQILGWLETHVKPKGARGRSRR
jgi:dipeptidyl aminopeptidase/acylaminoacyl peptidase